MPQLQLEPMFEKQIQTAKILAPRGTLTWRFITAAEGKRIIDAGVYERWWTHFGTRAIIDQIHEELPRDTAELAGSLERFGTFPETVEVVTLWVARQPCAWLRKGSDLHMAPLPALSMAMEVLELHRQSGKVNAGDAIAAVRTMLRRGITDTIPNALFRMRIVPLERSLANELAYRNAIMTTH